MSYTKSLSLYPTLAEKGSDNESSRQCEEDL